MPAGAAARPRGGDPGRTGARRARARLALAATVALAAATTVQARPARAAPHVPIAGDVALDRQVAHALDALVAGDVAEATVLARSLARHHPRFALGQLLHAELSATAALDGTLVGSRRAWPPALTDLLLEARARLDAVPPAGADDVRPSAPPALAPFVQLGHGVDHVVLVDPARSTLALHAVREGVATLVREHYVSSGSAGFGKRREGDRKTPLGLYRIVDAHEDGALPELYGAGALVLDYPNALDRHLGRTGSGIWLHGVPRERRSRAPHSSEGCVTMSNEHLRALDARLDPARTLVVLAASSGARRHEPGADARERHRTLFRRWRDELVGTGAAPSGLDAVDETDVTILESTVDGSPGAPDLLVMDIAPGVAGSAGITLWWTREGAAARWTLALEEGVRGGA